MALVDFKLDDVGGLFTSIREAITGKKIEDPVELAKIEAQLTQAETILKQGQININQEEAKNSNLFVAGWRPAVGWTCTVGLFYTAIMQPMLAWVSVNFGWVQPPVLDIGPLMTILGGLLGFGGYRAYEKVKGVAR